MTGIEFCQNCVGCETEVVAGLPPPAPVVFTPTNPNQRVGVRYGFSPRPTTQDVARRQQDQPCSALMLGNPLIDCVLPRDDVQSHMVPMSLVTVTSTT
jgi:hypothetical protein